MFDYNSPNKAAQEQPVASKELNKLLYELESTINVSLSNKERLEGVLCRIASYEEPISSKKEDPMPSPYPNGYLLDLYMKIQYLGMINRRTDHLLTEIEKVI